jgi:hypothetical protein
LSNTQFSTLEVPEINDFEKPEECYTTDMNYGATFKSCHMALDICWCKV